MKAYISSTTLRKVSAKTLSGWDSAILEARRQIAALRRSITVFREYQDLGVPFPEPVAPSEQSNGVVNDAFKPDSGKASV